MNPNVSNDDSMQAALMAQRAAFLRDGPPSLAKRRADLDKLKAAVLARQTDIEAALRADFGHRSAHETTIMEVLPLIQSINYQHRHLRKWMRQERRHVPMHFQPARAWVEYQPLGVVGIISPWNYPIGLALTPLSTALAAGNRAMIKPSEFTPASSALLVEMLGEIFSPDQVTVVTGDASVGKGFAALPFDHLLFTGSTPVGRAVMKAASENLVPVTLELGGKSPVIVEAEHPVRQAAQSIAYGKLANGGQTCIAPDYALVHEDDIDAFVSAFDQAVRTLYPDGPNADQYTSIVNEHHHERLTAMLEDARGRGATVRAVGVNAGAASLRAHTMAPTVVVGATDEMGVMHDEIFGPVLPVVSYRTLDEAIAYVNARPRPLALYYFGKETANQRRVLSLTTSGNVSINNALMHYAQEDLPFGGVGSSGIGAYHGIEGFKTLSHAKGVFRQWRWNVSELLRPPFGTVTNTILKLMLR